MISHPMRAAEIAPRMGITVDTFYKRRRRYQMVDGMPRPISDVGKPKWERSGMEAWLTRHHPARPSAPANDAEAPLQPGSIAEHQADLHGYLEQRMRELSRSS